MNTRWKQNVSRQITMTIRRFQRALWWCFTNCTVTEQKSLSRYLVSLGIKVISIPQRRAFWTVKSDMHLWPYGRHVPYGNPEKFRRNGRNFSCTWNITTAFGTLKNLQFLTKFEMHLYSRVCWIFQNWQQIFHYRYILLRRRKCPSSSVRRVAVDMHSGKMGTECVYLRFDIPYLRIGSL